ncbi:hypothetical protein APW49_13380, partial [Staphylococcus aureus]
HLITHYLHDDVHLCHVLFQLLFLIIDKKQLAQNDLVIDIVERNLKQKMQFKMVQMKLTWSSTSAH